jgi:hypothetical protein
LLICAALLVVAAADPLATLLSEFERLYLERRFGSIELYDLRGLASDLSAFLLALAFPLSLRVALSLTDLREKLDARPAASNVPPEESPPPARVPSAG